MLRKCIKLDGLTKALKSLPPTLDETYERILLSIDDENRNDAFKVLQWLAFSARPVTLAEMVEALAVDFTNSRPQFDPDQRMPDPEDILVICSSLVTTSNPISAMEDQLKGDISNGEDYHRSTLISGNREVKLAHFSVKEYLTGERIRQGSASHYSFNQKLADTLIAQTCLA